MTIASIKTVALIIAHPDDETLWAGGTILRHPSWNWFIVCLCRKNDKKRAPRFRSALKVLKADGIMGDLDDSPEQNPLDEKEIQYTILELLPPKHYDLIISHNPNGEYTRHIRHEETSKAVIQLWHAGKISADELWVFAYEDGNKAYYPKAVENATSYHVLAKGVWLTKYDIITDIYGFKENSWEALTTPRAEAFWHFFSPDKALEWMNTRGILI